MDLAPSKQSLLVAFYHQVKERLRSLNRELMEMQFAESKSPLAIFKSSLAYGFGKSCFLKFLVIAFFFHYERQRSKHRQNLFGRQKTVWF